MGLCLSSPTLGSAHPGYYGQRPPYGSKKREENWRGKGTEKEKEKKPETQHSISLLSFFNNNKKTNNHSRRLRRLWRLRRLDARRLRQAAAVRLVRHGRHGRDGRDGRDGAEKFPFFAVFFLRSFEVEREFLIETNAHTFFSFLSLIFFFSDGRRPRRHDAELDDGIGRRIAPPPPAVVRR